MSSLAPEHRWECCYVSNIYHDRLVSYINDLGKDGWRLVSIVQQGHGLFIAFLERSYEDRDIILAQQKRLEAIKMRR